jgi:hypothetical protein
MSPLQIWIFLAIGSALAGLAIGGSKGMATQGVLLGAIFGPIGLVVITIMQPRPPTAVWPPPKT